MAPSAYLRRARGLPPHVVARKAAMFCIRTIKRRARLAGDCLRGSYGSVGHNRNPAACIRIRAEDVPADLQATLLILGSEYLRHRFDLLGSGWLAPEYGFRPNGFLGRRYDPGAPPAPGGSGVGLSRLVGRANLPRARQAWALIRNADYRPIDWHLDFRSGYRWPSRRHSYRKHIPVDTGADIKVPWELGRMQHLPQLALCAILAASGRTGFGPADRYVQEIGDQLLDFIATNPPRFGVNWMSAMDVAIRAANIALALALLAGADRRLPSAVEAIVLSSLDDHARYIANHLDYSEIGRSNHYICEIAGLAWACWLMEATVKRDAWIEFAAREIETEARMQFLADGGNYEGSTNYHRLSGEAVLFAVGVLEALGRLMPREMLIMLRKAAALSQAVQGDDGTIVQIGDTDSGRFFKLHPTALPESLGGNADAFVENTLDHAGFCDGVAALFAPPPESARLEAILVHRLVGSPLTPPASEPPWADYGNLAAIETEIADLPEAVRRVHRLRLPRAVEPRDWAREAFPDFGLYVFRHDELLLAFRCLGGLASAAPSGHTHDDNLGLEYRLGPEERRDPGSYVYTPSVELRNAYRSASAHDVPRAADWPVAPPGSQLFALDHRAFATCLAWRPDGVVGEIRAPWGRILRLIRFARTEIIVTDVIAPARTFAAASGVEPSMGYGRLLAGDG